MLSFVPPARANATAPHHHLAEPLTPPAYLALRRTASGYSQEQLARALVLLADHYAPYPRPRLSLAEGRERYRKMLALVRLLERRGSVARCPQTLRGIASLFPFDAQVYRALAYQPASAHPRICRGCGCSGHDPCIDADDHVCRWVSPQLCTHCVDRGVSRARVAA